MMPMLRCKNNQTFQTMLQAIFVPKRFTSSETAPKVIKKWTFEESKKLVELVHVHGTQWQMISAYFPDRGRKSVASRYKWLMQKASGNLKELQSERAIYPARKWTPKEDKLLMELADENGSKWLEFESHFEQRSGYDLAQRFLILDKKNKTQKKGAWTNYEKERFDELIEEYGANFPKIASLIETRTIEQCRSRYSHFHGKKRTALNPTQYEQLQKAVAEYGFNDFQLLLRKAKLPLSLDEMKVRQYYTQELDPNIVKTPWTQQEITTMMELYNELDGCMELVQTRLPIKRGLKDMWTQYNNHVKNVSK